MPYSLLADLVVIIHLLFVLFAVFGGLLVFRWRSIIWVHLPALLWAILIEFIGWICPLTPLENWLRRQAENGAYQGGFVEHYIMPVLYPVDLTQKIQIILGVMILAFNLWVYWLLFRQTRSPADTSDN